MTTRVTRVGLAVVWCLALAACRSVTSPTMQALPLQAGTYTLTLSSFRTDNLAQTGLCVLPPAGFTVPLPATLRSQGTAWLAAMTTPLVGESAQLVLDPWDGRSVTGRATGTAVASTPAGGRGVSFGDAQVASATLADGTVTGIMGGHLVFTYSDGATTWACAADRANFELKRAQ